MYLTQIIYTKFVLLKNKNVNYIFNYYNLLKQRLFLSTIVEHFS